MAIRILWDQLPERLAEALARIRDGERVVVTEGDLELFALVPIDDFHLLEEVVDAHDWAIVDAVHEEMVREGTVPWDDVPATWDRE